MKKTYSELMELDSYEERFNYLRLNGDVGTETFGAERYLNQALYTSKEWRALRDKIIIRDNACEMGLDGYDIFSEIIIHHINPVTIAMIEERDPIIFDPENLICVSRVLHNAIHYGDMSGLLISPRERCPNDTCPWKEV